MKLARIIAGIALVIVAGGFLMEGGIVRQHVLGTRLDWRWLSIGLPLLVTGVLMIKPPGFLQRAHLRRRQQA